MWSLRGSNPDGLINDVSLYDRGESVLPRPWRCQAFEAILAPRSNQLTAKLLDTVNCCQILDVLTLRNLCG